MNKIKKFNEGLFYTTKNDLYLKNKTWEEMERRFGPTDCYLAMRTSLKSAKSLCNGEIQSECGTGIFYTNRRYGNKVDFGNPDWNYTSCWYSISYFTPKLFEVTKKLGYEIGKKVTVINTGIDGTIIDIKPLVFYNYDDDEDIYDIITLAYKIQIDNSNDEWHQITNLQIVKHSTPMNIVEEEIEDNFIDYIDTNQVKFVTRKYSSEGNDCFDCKILFNINKMSILAEFTSRINTMSKRLMIKNISTKLTSFTLAEVQFTCRQN